MNNVAYVYPDEWNFIMSATDIKAQIAQCNVIIAALLVTMGRMATNAGISRVSLNDGQTIIDKSYRNPNQIMETVNAIRVFRSQLMMDIQKSKTTCISPQNVTFSSRF